VYVQNAMKHYPADAPNKRNATIMN